MVATKQSRWGQKPRLQVDLRALYDLSGNPIDREREWLRVYDHYGPRLEDYFSGRVADRNELGELLAGIWERAFRNIATLRSERALWSWLTTIGKNLLTDFARRKQVKDHREVAYEDLRADDCVELLVSEWIGGRSGSVENENFAEETLSDLSEDEREFLSLYAIDGLSHEEISIHLGLPSAAASRQRLRRLRARFTPRDETG